jgi:hypothetical protein
MKLASLLLTTAALTVAVAAPAAEQEPAPAAPPTAAAAPATRPVPEELTDAVAHAATLSGDPLPIGTMSELMIHLIYPTSDAILYITTRTPTTDVEWNELSAKALTLAESANLLMMPSRVMAPKEQWMKDAQLMLDAGAAAFEAAKNKDVAALEELNQAVYDSCLVCHFHYRPDYGKPKPTD